MIHYSPQESNSIKQWYCSAKAKRACRYPRFAVLCALASLSSSCCYPMSLAELCKMTLAAERNNFNGLKRFETGPRALWKSPDVIFLCAAQLMRCLEILEGIPRIVGVCQNLSNVLPRRKVVSLGPVNCSWLSRPRVQSDFNLRCHIGRDHLIQFGLADQLQDLILKELWKQLHGAKSKKELTCWTGLLIATSAGPQFLPLDLSTLGMACVLGISVFDTKKLSIAFRL